MAAGPELNQLLNINLVSVITLNSAFLEVFKNVSKRTVVNLTGPSAMKARQCFGMTSMTTSSKQLLLSILALDEKNVKVQ